MPTVLYVLIPFAVVLAVWVAASWPIQNIMPAYVHIAESLWSGHFSDTFYPIGYPFLIGGWFGSVETTIRIIHLLCLLATWLVVFGMLKRQVMASVWTPEITLPIVFWASVLLLNPYYIAGLIRVGDGGVDLFLVACLFGFMLETVTTLTGIIGGGIALGIFVLVRPNALSLAVAVGLAMPRNIRLVTVLGLSSLFAYGLLCYAATGHLFFWPSNGGYNLFAGNNPFAMAGLTSNYNGEYTLTEGLNWCGIAENRYAVAQSDYIKCAIRFIAENPWETIRLWLYKAFTLLFRPNLRLADTPFKTILQIALVLPTYAWWGMIVSNSAFRRSRAAGMGLLFIVLYALPFILTNADPRFRIPLDVVYAMSALSFLMREKPAE